MLGTVVEFFHERPTLKLMLTRFWIEWRVTMQHVVPPHLTLFVCLLNLGSTWKVTGEKRYLERGCTWTQRRHLNEKYREVQSTLSLFLGQSTMKREQQVASALKFSNWLSISQKVILKWQEAMGTRLRSFSEEGAVIMWGAACSTFVC